MANDESNTSSRELEHYVRRRSPNTDCTVDPSDVDLSSAQQPWHSLIHQQCEHRQDALEWLDGPMLVRSLVNHYGQRDISQKLRQLTGMRGGREVRRKGGGVCRVCATHGRGQLMTREHTEVAEIQSLHPSLSRQRETLAWWLLLLSSDGTAPDRSR